MNVAGPSRVQPSGRLASRGRVESTYEEDLLELLDQLSLDEVDEIQSFFTHRTRAGNHLSDHDVAMNDLLQQARALADMTQDRALAQRIAAGEEAVDQQVQRPVAVVDARTVVQQNARQQPAARSNNGPSQTWGEWFSSVMGWAFGADPVPETTPTNLNASTALPKAPVVNRPTGHSCVICQDSIYGAEVRAPCGHYYGIDCITDLFQSAARDETLFPPRCCRQNIPLPQVQPHLSRELITTFQQKQVEFGTLKRVYCSSPTCSRFLGPVSEGLFDSKVYTCPAPGCGRRTCGRCREQHNGNWTHNCRPDADTAQVLELGRASGWARCPGCSQMIELHIGCFHMTCRCRTEFCYLCRARWKTCQCPHWDERRLTAAAEERVNARLGLDQERGARRDVPPQRAGPVPNPVFIPANRAPAPAPAQRPVPAPALVRVVPPVTPERTIVPAQSQTQTRHPQPTPARASTVSSSAARPTSTASTSRTGTDRTVEDRLSGLAVAPTLPANSGSAAQASTPGWRSKRLASGSKSAKAPTPASTPTSVPVSSTSAATTNPGLLGGRARKASTSTSGLASGSKLTGMSTPAPAPPFTGSKTMHNVDPTRQRLVREMMERLREDHGCDHARWRYRSGGGVCQSCGNYLPLYLFRCQGCEMLACKQCKCNRL